MTNTKDVFSESLANMLSKLTSSSLDTDSEKYLDKKPVYSTDSIDGSLKSKLLTVISHEEDSLKVRILLPLADRNSIKISLEDSKNLNVKADFFNIFSGNPDTFEHTIPVNSSLSKGYPIDRTQKVTAKYTDGVLIISIPLTPKEIVEITLE